MSIHFISGKPGGGKTLYSVRMIVDELVCGDRCVITNVPLLLPQLNEFLQRQYPRAFQKRFTGETIRHISDRVMLIDEDDLPKFFTFRPDGVRLDSVSNQEWKSGKRPDFSIVKDGGVLYVLDEVHVAFNARAWADTGHEVLYYLSQHRKLGDDVICITQSINNVDKQFRSVAQDYTYIKNLAKQRVGLFRLPGIFTRNTYLQPATDTSKPVETGTFTLDVTGLASCYDTARGVGIHGRGGADTKERKTGLHWAWLIVAGILLWVTLTKLPEIIAWATDPHTKKTPPARLAVPAAPVPVNPAGPASMPDVYQPPAFRTNQLPEIFCTGYAVLSGQPEAFFSDGSTAEPPDLTEVTKSSVTVSGKVYKLRPVVNRPTYADTQPAYVPDTSYMPRSPFPVANQADVTFIGQNYARQHQPPPRLNGMGSMNRMTSPARQTQSPSEPVQVTQ